MDTSLASLGPRLERAQCQLNRSLALAVARARPESSARCLDVGAGFALFLGAGNLMNQALCLALGEPISAAELDAVEALLGQGGAEVKLETAPFADPSLFLLLAARGYRIGDFQQVLWRALDDAPSAPLPEGILVRPAAAHEAELFGQVVMAGFLEQDALPDAAASPFPREAAEGASRWLAFVDGAPAGGGTLGVHDGVATLAGTSTLPRFRGRGVQSALVRARLAAGRAAGCTLAVSSTLPATQSFRNLLRFGFQVLYPKVELIRGNWTP